MQLLGMGRRSECKRVVIVVCATLFWNSAPRTPLARRRPGRVCIARHHENASFHTIALCHSEPRGRRRHGLMAWIILASCMSTSSILCQKDRHLEETCPVHCGLLSGLLHPISHPNPSSSILVVGRAFPCLLSAHGPDPEKHPALSSALPGSGR
ncbi:hypothetical protein IG631_20069 [Alternaria alternata]|nr:hypothetical protein IG631_20069 [Alternaria alternata]